jgi:hypothetical protein
MRTIIDGTTHMRKSSDWIVFPLGQAASYRAFAEPVASNCFISRGNKRTSPRERSWTRHFVKTSIISCPEYKWIAGVGSVQHGAERGDSLVRARDAAYRLCKIAHGYNFSPGAHAQQSPVDSVALEVHRCGVYVIFCGVLRHNAAILWGVCSAKGSQKMMAFFSAL